MNPGNVFSVQKSLVGQGRLGAALAAWYGLAAPLDCRLYEPGLNDTYLVLSGQDKYFCRVYTSGWRTNEDVRWELELLRHLEAQGCPVAAVVPALDGRLFQEVLAPEGPRQVALFKAAIGRYVRNRHQRFETAAAYGRGMASIHDGMDSFEAGAGRFRLDLAHLMDEPLGRMAPVLVHRPDDLDFLTQIVPRLRTRIESLIARGLSTGICHGDFHGGNALYNDERGAYTFFDFDCAGPGWRAYDLAVFRWATEASESEDKATIWDGLLSGYASVRPIAAIDLEAVPALVAARTVWFLGLHAGLNPIYGTAHMHDGFLDQWLGLLRRWVAQELGNI